MDQEKLEVNTDSKLLILVRHPNSSSIRMSNSQQISDLLEVAMDIPILRTGINDTATEYSTYPVKEHNRLLSTSGKPMNTPLNSLLSMRNVRSQRIVTTLIIKIELLLPTSKFEWEEYYLHLVPLVIEHTKILLSESKIELNYNYDKALQSLV
jgi:hypothetical protein